MDTIGGFRHHGHPVQDVTLAVISLKPFGNAAVIRPRSRRLAEIGGLDGLVGGDFLRRAFGEELALIEHHDAIAR